MDTEYYCPGCNRKIKTDGAVEDETGSCPHCGTGLWLQESTQEPVQKKSKSKHASAWASEAMDWARLFARVIDINVVQLLMVIFIAFAFPKFLEAPTLKITIVLGSVFLLMFFESVAISQWGTTFGKWLLGIKITEEDGKNLTYRKSLSRSLEVYWRGMGLGIPLIALLTMLRAYKRLKYTGNAAWDERLALTVTHKRMSVLRAILLISLAALVYYLIY